MTRVRFSGLEIQGCCGWLAGGLPGCELFLSPICKQGRLGRKSFGKGFFQGKLVFAVMLQLFMFQVSNAMTN